MMGRTTEFKRLQQFYQKDGNQLVVLYGRNEMGKGELLKAFSKGKKTLVYVARQASPRLQRQMMKEEIENKYKITIQDTSYETFFNRIRSGDASKLLFIIDGFEHIVKKDPEFMEAIVKLKDKKLYPGPVMILLCSSSLVWVEKDMTRCLGPGAKKVTGLCKLKELDFVDVVRFFPKNNVRECIEVYGILGGVPGYLRRWDGDKTLKKNICDNILSRNGFLYGEAQRYIGNHLRELSVYNTILCAIAGGKSKLNDLFLETGFSRAKISVYLKNLMALEVIEKVVSFETGGWDNAQKGLYQIKNTYNHFWYKFVYPHLTDLYYMKADTFYDIHIGPQLEDYLDTYFKKVCMEYLELMSMVGKLPIKIQKLGTWVGKQGNIDIIGQNAQRENIVGLCNWSREQLTYEMLEQLKESMKLARIKAKRYYLFSAKSFDMKLMEQAKEDDSLVLIDMNRL